jgi:hypothetical protein
MKGKDQTVPSPAAATLRRRRIIFRCVGLVVLTACGCALLTNASLRGDALAKRSGDPSLADTAGSSSALHDEQASSAAAFVDSIGVQTHINYTDTPYANWQQVLAEINRLGVRHIRDALPLTPTFVKNHQQLAAAGIRCTCGFSINKGNAPTPEAIVQAARAASDVEALEAPNECDAGTNCGGGSDAGVTHVMAVLPQLAQAARTLQVPAIGPSFTRQEAYAASGPITPWMTYGNLHVYFGGRNPGSEGWGAGDEQGHRYGSFDWWLDQSKRNAPSLPELITETGYEAFDTPTRPGTIPVQLEGTYLVRTLLLAWNHGVQRTFIYEMLDEFPDSGYGLLRHDLSEKPAYLAIKNLLSLLKDSSSTVPHGRLGIDIESTDRSLAHTLLQKADGSYYLILWLERSGFDAQTLRVMPVPAAEVRIKLQDTYGVADVTSFDENGTIETSAMSTAQSSLTLRVNDRLKVLRIVSPPGRATSHASVKGVANLNLAESKFSDRAQSEKEEEP